MMLTEIEKLEATASSFPDLHDGYLEGILVSKDKNLILSCRDVTSREWLITVPKLHRLKADNFSEGNIIFEITLYVGDNCPHILIRKLQGYREEKAAESLSNDLEKISKGNWTLVEITSSYGCELLALSEAEASFVTCKCVTV